MRIFLIEKNQSLSMKKSTLLVQRLIQAIFFESDLYYSSKNNLPVNLYKDICFSNLIYYTKKVIKARFGYIFITKISSIDITCLSQWVLYEA